MLNQTSSHILTFLPVTVIFEPTFPLFLRHEWIRNIFITTMICASISSVADSAAVFRRRSSEIHQKDRNIFSPTSAQFSNELYSPKCMVSESLSISTGAVPWITVDLDLPPKLRFQKAYGPFAEDTREVIGIVKSFIRSLLGQFTVKMVEKLMTKAHAELFPSPYKEEIEGIAEATGVSVGDLAMLNIFYELSRFCTSIVAEADDGRLYHARNLDFGQLFGWNSSTHTWTLTEALKKITLNVDYMRGGNLLFKGTTFAGHVGIITGMKPNAFTISINSKLKPDLKNLMHWLTGIFVENNSEGTHFVLWSEREALTNCNTYEEAKRYLSTVKLLAGCYFILGGRYSGEGVVIVRTPDATQQYVELDPEKGKWFLLQTNYDPPERPFFLDNRSEPGMKCMRELGPNGLTLAGLYKVLSSKTTLNKTTVHTVIMEISSGAYQTFIQKCPDPCWFI
ncbi:linear amide c-N hydrolase, choloylglycine hydrolase family domain-containing protein [Ditylenchus destructor]|uniref:Linear amide c-N hydrolase, choloylglycine hydrolase family domain-containing protein n=1 Tax=Ditylenchus destructor TaxID=166010 RepID=A0AAD4MTX3_9BILA|nr:linear amide c-N hydrolase, choloylglycine hydrolase family domain-containing protein [Ditylenchus destructor]